MTNNPFRPAWWLANKHLQTIIPSKFRTQPTINTQRQRLNLADGDFLDVDVYQPQNISDTTPSIVLLHGLEGSSQSQYIQAMLHQAKKHNYQGVAVNFRGCSGEANTRPQSYHSGKTDDIEAVLQHYKKLRPKAALIAVGYSLGGSALLNYLAKCEAKLINNGDEKLVHAAIAVSVPFNLASSANSMNKGFSKVYRNHFIKPMTATVKRKEAFYKKHGFNINYDKLNAKKDFWVFDHEVTAPLHGYESAEDYYQQCSSKTQLKNIQTSTLLIHALDDPFMSPQDAPTNSDINQHITLGVTQKGGHLGFVSGSIPFKPDYTWLEKTIMTYIKQQLTH